MTRSELVESIARKQRHLDGQDVELAVRRMLEHMSQALAAGERIEIRGFGSFSLHFRPPRMARNPKTGEAAATCAKHVPRFRPGKELRDRVNAASSGASFIGSQPVCRQWDGQCATNSLASRRDKPVRRAQ